MVKKMAKMTDVPGAQNYSSGVKKVLILGKDGKNMVSATNPLPTNAIVTVDTMNLTAEMKVDSGHDLYEATNVTRTADLAVSFDSIAGLTLSNIQSVENKTQGYIYNTGGAIITNTTITLSAAAQTAGYPVIAIGDEIEVIYRSESRLTNGTQTSGIKSTISKKTASQDLSTGALNYTTDYTDTYKINSVMIRFSTPITQRIKIELDNGTGAGYDTILRDDTFTTPISNYVWQPDFDLILFNTDKLNITCTNTGTPASTAYMTILGDKR